MPSSLRFTLFALCVFAASCARHDRPLHLEVNPFIGTGGHGHTYPGATSPFGMVQLSPDTRLEGWDGCGGYHDTDNRIYGFSHTHLQGTGVSDYGDILLMPCPHFGEGELWRDRYSSTFQKSSERAHAGHYAVTLDRGNVDVELTTTPRVGIHRYRMAQPDTLMLIIDLAHRDDLLHYSIYPLDDHTLVGHRVSKNWAEEQHVHFAMSFDQPFDWQDQMTEVTRQDTLADGTVEQEVAFVPVFRADFGVLDELNVHVALSFCDTEGALRNLEAEVNGFDFDRHRQANEARWDDQLGRILVDGGSKDERTTFYSALYHATTVPNLASDVDGRYRGTDLQVHQLEESEGEHYTVFSLWDTYRALHPLLAWIEPERTKDMVRSMLRMYEDGGQLPVWELASNYTGCMIGYHSVPVIVDALAWGIDDWDPALALEAMVQAADSMHLGLDAYAALGYIPSDHEHESVSKTLEYTFDDACIAQLARELGDAQLEQRFARRAAHWKNLFNPESGFIQPKRQGAWIEGFDPREVNFNFTEANGWQYAFSMQHDVGSHIELLGGDSAYLAKLDGLFSAPIQTTGRVQPDITGLIGQYAHGNEPSHHVAYLASYAGDPGASAKRVNEICDSFYSNAPDGLCGNEDCGQMSAWYVWSALGMYPVTPAAGEVVMGSPRFKRAVVQPAQGHPPTEIRARGLNPMAIYPSALRLHASDGTSSPMLKQSFIDIDWLRRGGLVEVLMASKPDPLFGVAPELRPHSDWEAEGFVAVPSFTAPRTFQADSIEWSVDHLHHDALVECSQDGGLTWHACHGTQWADQTTDLLARASLNGDTSVVVRHRILKVDHNWTLSLEHEPDNQYLAGGLQALIDGIEGGNDFRTGEWQGYWGTDMVATIDLGEVQEVTSVSLGALQDIKPWIWMPKRVLFAASSDGIDFDVFDVQSSTTAEDDEEVSVEKFITSQPIQTRFLQVQAEAHPPIPDWHLGRDNDRWMFLDEIHVELK